MMMPAMRRNHGPARAMPRTGAVALAGFLALLAGGAPAQQVAPQDLTVREAVRERIDRFHHDTGLEVACSILKSYSNSLAGLDKLVTLAGDHAIRGRGFERIRVSDFFRDTDHNHVVVIDFHATPARIRAHLLKQRPELVPEPRDQQPSG